MNRLTLLLSIMTTLTIIPGLVSAQILTSDPLFSIEIAKSGCCKARKSPQHPWAKTNMTRLRGRAPRGKRLLDKQPHKLVG